jgi:hypothetical protein
MKKKARLIAFYLPQFHPIPENDKWWGKGFTEWTNVTKAKPLFKGHKQPKLPSDLGFYDLRLPQIRQAQAELAYDFGIEGFCYWHYWLGNGKRLLELPFDEVLKTKEPNFPFCLGWANHNWQGKGWMGTDKCLINQTYPGKIDAKQHFEFLLKAFMDNRYLRNDDKPILVIYRPNEIPDCRNYLYYWRDLASKHGLKDLFIIGDTPAISNDDLGLDGTLFSGQRHLPSFVWEKFQFDRFIIGKRPLKKIKYENVIPYLIKPGGYKSGEFPIIIPNWDTTPRLKEEAIVFYDNHPEHFRKHIRQVFDEVANRPYQDNLVFIRSWNEWAEGNYLEPDAEFGTAFLNVLKEENTLM